VWARVITKDRWAKCSPPFSFYNDLIQRYWAGGPSEESGAPIHRVCTLARKMGASSIVIEDATSRADVAEEIEHLERCSGVEAGEVSACSITFLSSGVRRRRDYAGVPGSAVIGQVTIVTFPIDAGPRSYIYEAVIRLPGRKGGAEQLLNNHVPISGDLKVAFGGTEHLVKASYFCQQNGVSSICPHSAVRTLVRTLTDLKISVPVLNDMWGYDPETRKVTTVQVEEALREYGLRSIAYDPMKSPAGVDESWDLPALLADSGSPSLLVLSEGDATDHVIPVLGHTINSDEWHPIGAKLYKNGEDAVSSSSLWTDHLVMHDDMLGPYYCLSKAGLLPRREAKLRPRLTIAILPKGVLVSPTQAEDFARQILGLLIGEIEEQKFGRGRWWRHLAELRERRVFRTTLIGRDEYLATLPTDPSTVDYIALLNGALPKQMWMSEISVPNLFLANRAKLGEILMSMETLPSDEDPSAIMETMVGFRLPSIISCREIDGNPTFDVRRWHELGHRPIYAPSHHSNRW
jgi:hypothetical protein